MAIWEGFAQLKPHLEKLDQLDKLEEKMDSDVPILVLELWRGNT